MGRLLAAIKAIIDLEGEGLSVWPSAWEFDPYSEPDGEQLYAELKAAYLAAIEAGIDEPQRDNPGWTLQ